MKKRIISNFNDQVEYKNNIGTTVFPRKESGNQNNEENNSESSINLKNSKARTSLSLRDGVQINDYVSNYLMKDFRSTNDSEHYFAGFKKYINLNLAFFSATNILPNSSSFSLIDSFGLGNAATALGAFNKGPEATGIAISPKTGEVYVCGVEQRTGTQGYLRSVVRKYSLSNKTFTTVDTYGINTANLHTIANAITVSPVDNSVYYVGYEPNAAGSAILAFIRKSSTGASGTFSNVANFLIGTTNSAVGIAVSPIDGAVYAAGSTNDGYFSIWKSTTGNSGTFIEIDTLTGSVGGCHSIAVSPIDGAVYAAGKHPIFDEGIVRRSATRRLWNF